MRGDRLQVLFFRLANRLVAQPASQGALPSLYAATSPDVVPGGYYGPDRFGEMRGHPKLVTASREAYDEDAARRLWQISEELTGVRYEFSPGDAGATEGIR